MKKNFLICSLLLMCLTLPSCDAKNKEIAVLLYDSSDPFIENVGQYINEIQLTNYHLTFYNCKKSQILQNEIAEKLYKEGVDLLIINPVDRLSSYIFIQKSIKENIPIIFFNREPLREDLEKMQQVYYVGADASQSGKMQADMIAKAFDRYNNPNYLNHYDKNNDNIIQCVILKGEQGHQDAEERTTAVIDELESNGYRVQVLLTTIDNWSEDEAYRDMESVMDQYGEDIELIISNNDAMAIGAVKYLKDNNYYEEEVNGIIEKVPFLIVGIDGLEEAKELVEKGYLYGTILNDGENMAKAIMELSQMILEEPDKILNYDLIDKKYIWISYENFSAD